MVFHAELENEAQTSPNMVKNQICIKNPILNKNRLFNLIWGGLGFKIKLSAKNHPYL